MTLRSSLYVGSVMHRRLQPRMHSFRYNAFWFLLDLDELAELSRKLRWFSYNRPNVFSFYDADHGDGTATPLRTQIERQLGEAGVDIAGGRVHLLCMPRTLGYCFNPLSIFFCYRADATLVAVVYQVHNTFGERHSYVIRVEDHGGALHQHCRKLFYVSPFLDMDLRYDFRITGPDERIAVGISASSSGKACAARRFDGSTWRLHRSQPDDRLPEDSCNHDQSDRCHSLGGISAVGEGDWPAPAAAAARALGDDCHREFSDFGLKRHVHAAPRSYYSIDQFETFAQFKFGRRSVIAPDSGPIWSVGSW